MKYWTIVFCLAAGMLARGALISENTAFENAQAWMAGNPVMGPAGRTMASIETFPATGYQVFIVRLAPRGYLVLNTDDALPLIVSFSAESNVVLDDVPANAFRAMLLRHIERMEALLRQPAKLALLQRQPVSPLAVTELHGPFMQTAWNQNNPYNQLCPDDPSADEIYGPYYGFRVSTGCTPTAYAQVMNFHGWPLRGFGAHTYTDNKGDITGTHSVVFSDVYDWASMLNTYDPWNANPTASERAVAELMYALGVAAEANYEAGGTSASITTLGLRLGDFFYYEPCVKHDSQAALIAPLETDLRAGLPCVVAIPGHAIVADGLMVDSGSTTYHINYGWGGLNNGWWDADNVAGVPLEYGVTSLRPQLLAFPVESAVTGTVGEAAELQWILPKRRETEAEKLTILRLEEQASPWQSDASELHATINSGWQVVAGGYSGSCWYAGPKGPAAMVLDEILLPDASSTLTFRSRIYLGTATFTVSVSTNDGLSFVQIYSDNNKQEKNWQAKSLSLANFAGMPTRLRFALSDGSYYPNSGGVWIDNLAMTSGGWLDWVPFFVDVTLASNCSSSVVTNLTTGIHTLAARITDSNYVIHALAPSFSMIVYDNDGMPTEWEKLYGLDPFENDGHLDLDGDGYTNLEEYIAGTHPGDSNSFFRVAIVGKTIQWPALENRTYGVLKADEPAGPFELLQSVDGPTSNFTDNASDFRRFYKVNVEL